MKPLPPHCAQAPACPEDGTAKAGAVEAACGVVERVTVSVTVTSGEVVHSSGDAVLCDALETVLASSGVRHWWYQTFCLKHVSADEAW